MVSEKEKKLLDYMWEQANNLADFIRRNEYPESHRYSISLEMSLGCQQATSIEFYKSNHLKRRVEKSCICSRTAKIEEKTWEDKDDDENG
jgi:hypothetical protein